jgi:L-fuculose-phosphate aldolase
MDDARAVVAVGSRILGAAGQADWIWGHAALRDANGRGVWMKAADYGFEEIVADRVLLVGWDGEVLDGTGRAHLEYPIHTEVMRAQSGVGAVVHTHAEHAVALAAAGVELRPVSHSGTWFVPPAVPRFELTGDLITTPELGRSVADALSDHWALFLVNHGLVVTGPDIETAVVRAVMLEHACRQQLLALAFGGTLAWSSDEEALSKRAKLASPRHVQALWRYFQRGLDRP